MKAPKEENLPLPYEVCIKINNKCIYESSAWANHETQKGGGSFLIDDKHEDQIILVAKMILTHVERARARRIGTEPKEESLKSNAPYRNRLPSYEDMAKSSRLFQVFLIFLAFGAFLVLVVTILDICGLLPFYNKT